MIRKDNSNTSLLFMIGFGIVGLLSLGACSSPVPSEIPEQSIVSETQSQESLEAAVPEPIPTTPLLPTEAANPVKPINEESSEEYLNESYPESPLLPSEQSDSPDLSYPAPDSDFGYPPPQIDGYPSPGQNTLPPPKPQLIATAPSTVNLTSGSPQLVEFFAFW